VTQSTPVPGATLELDRITHRYPGGAMAVEDISAAIGGGELVSLLGPSGCGKTTLLRVIAGFIAQSEGSVRVNGTAIDAATPNRRPVGIVFQNYALFPHMTVAANIAYGLAARGIARARQADTVRQMLELVQLSHLAERMPRQLSGGQQQRVALARALAVQPSILLLDEPFAALDKNLRLDMQIEVKRLQRISGITTILVTHDQEEALSMSDRVAVLSQGRLEQFAPPTEVYDRPHSLFVNSFVGAANILPGRMLGTSGNEAAVELNGGPRLRLRKPHLFVPDGGEVVVCLRPEHLCILPPDAMAPDGAAFPGTVTLGLPLGASMVHEVSLGQGVTVKIAQPRGPGAAPYAANTAVHLVQAPPGPDGLPPGAIFPTP
jgi:putative spermidine/putrescine transport system ATP-binding protein